MKLEGAATCAFFALFRASLDKANKESTVAIDWFADVTVFNSVDFNTSVVLAQDQKQGKAVGDHSVDTSSGSTRTSYSLVCVEE